MNNTLLPTLLIGSLVAFNTLAATMAATMAAPMAATASTETSIKIATFNISMEALNYVPYQQDVAPKVTGTELTEALASGHQQIKNIAEIIQRVNPDIILLNEFDRLDDNHQNLKTFIEQYLAVGQQQQQGITYPYFFQGPVNTGVKSPVDFNNNRVKDEVVQDTYGFGYFPGHFGMALLSKYPIDQQHIRTFQLFKWKDMPGALITLDPETNQPWYSEQAWQQMRLSSKAHWDIPVIVNNQTIHVLASHPTPPVFDGPEDSNGKRNHDEIRLWADYITPGKNAYIYDDKQRFGGLAPQQRFVILGDQNASVVDGDAMKSGIGSLLALDSIQDAMPHSEGGKLHSSDNSNGQYHTAFWRMRADYILPSTHGWQIMAAGVFWPTPDDESFRLIKDRSASSDHRLVWLDLKLKNIP